MVKYLIDYSESLLSDKIRVSQKNMAEARCNTNGCEHFFTMKNRSNPSAQKNKRFIGLDKIDMDHLYDHHLWLWAEYQAERANALQQENAALRLTVEALRVKAQPPKPNVDLPIAEADPENYRPGFCNALFVHPQTRAVLKCTERCKYNRDVCGVHIDHTDTLTRFLEF